jgi:hypothetical protein
VPRASDLNGDLVAGADVELFDKLKFEIDEEQARLCIPSDDPQARDIMWVEWVHTMRGPELDEDGRPIATMIKGKKGSRPGWLMSFVGQRCCLGRDDVLRKQRIDPEMCPACAVAQAGTPDMEPARRFALPVIRYDTAGKKTSTLRNPPGARIYVWALTQKYYNQLVSTREQAADLLQVPVESLVMRNYDVVVLCEDAGFQRLSFKSAMRPAWEHPAVAPVISTLWGDPANRPSDEQLRAALGRDADAKWLRIDAEDVQDRWRRTETAASGTPAGNGQVTGGADLADGIDAILGDPGPAVADPFAGPAADPFGGGQPAQQPAAAAPADPFAGQAAPPATAADPFGGQPPAAQPAAPAHPGGVAEFAPPGEQPAVAAAEQEARAAAPPPAVPDPFGAPSAASQAAAVPAAAALPSDPFGTPPAAPAAEPAPAANGAAGPPKAAASFTEILAAAGG